MPAVVTLVSPSADALRDAVEALRSRLPDVKSVDELGPGAVDLVSAAAPGDLRGEITAALAGRPVDHCLQSPEDRRKHLLIADMDSTIISCECLDELADYAGSRRRSPR